jgi:hypothetical protein
MKKKKRRLRSVIQILFFILIAFIAVNHTLLESGKGIPLLSGASLHAVCPFGGVVSLYQLATSGTFVKKIHESSVILMIIVFGSAFLLGPLFCGWICPFGSFQEILGRLGKKLFKRRYNHFIPYKYDRILRYFRYVILMIVLIQTARSGLLMFANIDPYFALFQFWTGEVTRIAIIALLVVMGLSLFVERPFCKYACPYGALLGLFNLIRIVPLKRNVRTCINCSRCDRSCPMNITVSSLEVIRNHQCISCFQCTSDDGVCPIPGTVEFRTGTFKESDS